MLFKYLTVDPCHASLRLNEGRDSITKNNPQFCICFPVQWLGTGSRLQCDRGWGVRCWMLQSVFSGRAKPVVFRRVGRHPLFEEAWQALLCGDRRSIWHILYPNEASNLGNRQGTMTKQWVLNPTWYRKKHQMAGGRKSFLGNQRRTEWMTAIQ